MCVYAFRCVRVCVCMYLKLCFMGRDYFVVFDFVYVWDCACVCGVCVCVYVHVCAWVCAWSILNVYVCSCDLWCMYV